MLCTTPSMRVRIKNDARFWPTLYAVWLRGYAELPKLFGAPAHNVKLCVCPRWLSRVGNSLMK